MTGGTRGIGAAIAEALDGAGYTVAVSYSGNGEAARDFTARTGIASFRWDVSDHDACREGVGLVEEQIGSIDVLVNNAGTARDGFLHRMEYEDWSRIVDVNLSSCFYMCRAVIVGMRERGFGRIINISSVNAQSGMLGLSNYAAAKAGMLGLTKSLALEGASKGVTVNAVAPGYVDTDLIAHISDAMMQRIVSGIPVGRVAQPREVARCVLFLADEDAGFITGSTLSVNGGAHMA